METKMIKESKVEKIKIRSKYYWAVAFFLGALAMYVMLSYSQMLTTGKYIILAGDALDYVSNIRMIAGNIRHGETIWYSFGSFLGMNTVPILAKGMFSPFNLLYILFYKADVNIITAIVIILKTGLAAASFQFFAAKVLKVRNYYSILFAVFYSMCSFAVLFGIINFMWLDGLYVLPVVALATEKAFREGKYSLLTIAHSYMFVVQMYQGYLILFFSIMYFLLLLFLREKGRQVRPVWKHICRYFGSVIISVMISLFILFPIFLFLRANNSYSLSFRGTETSLMQVFNNLFWGEVQTFMLAPYMYCGIPCLLLFPFYFINKKIEIRERIRSGVLVVFFAIACIFPPLLAFLHAFEKVEMWNFRFGFILAFLICAVACKEIAYIKHIKMRSVAFYCLFLILFFVVEGRLERLEIGNASHNNLLGLGINFGFIALWIGMVYAYIQKSKHRKTVSVLLVFVALFETISNGCFCLSSDVYRNFVNREEYYYAWSDDIEYVMNEVNQNEQGNDFYRMVLNGDYNNNSDAFGGFYGLSDCGSWGNERIRSFLKDMGLYIEDERISPTGLTLPMEMLLSVKYKARLHSDMEVMGYDTKPDIKENENVLPFAFIANESILDNYDMTDNSFENQNRIFGQLSGIDDLFIPVDNALISRDEDGLLLDEDNSVIYSNNNGTGVIVFRVSNTNNPVYMQISSSSLQENPMLFYDQSENMSFSSDNSVLIPFAAKLWQSGDNHYLSLRKDEGISVNIPVDDINVYELDKDKMKEIETSLKRNQFYFEKIKNGYIKGSVSVSDESRVLFTSIPFEEGWKAYVNNKEFECVPVLDETFLGIVLPDRGDYEIELKYSCPGKSVGMLLSFLGICLLVIQLLFERKTVKKSEKRLEIDEDSIKVGDV